MAPIIWGLDLGEITWSKFGNKNMWNTKYHLRRSKIIFYQLAMIFCVISESLGTAALSDYVDQQRYIQQLDNRALEYNDDYVGVGSYNIFSGVFLAFVFGAAFFFDLIWPERHEDRGIRWAWKICAIAAAVFELASAFALTIITATRSAYVSGVGSDRAEQLLRQVGKGPLEYNRNGRAIAAVVFVWPGAIFAIVSAILLWMSHIHDDAYGDPYSTHYREELKAHRATAETELTNYGQPATAEADLEKATRTDRRPTSSSPNTMVATEAHNDKISQEGVLASEPVPADNEPGVDHSTGYR